MRFRYVVMVAAASIISAGAGGGAQSGDAKAAAVMAEARKALGGEQKIAGLKALSLRASYTREGAPMGGGGGSMTVVMMGPGPAAGGGAPQMSGDLEIDVEFPDKYIKVDTSTGMMAMTRTEGFEGDRPFTELSSSQPGVRLMAPRPDENPAAREAAWRRSSEELARLMLGLIAGTPPSFAATYSYAGQAESPDGKADVIDVTSGDTFAARLFLDAQSHLPLMLTYMAPEPRMVMRTTAPGRGDAGRAGGDMASGRGAPPQGAGAPPADERDNVQQAIKAAAATPAKIIEYRMFFGDYREVSGLRLPHHIGRGTADKTTEEWAVKSYKVNPVLKADRFKAGK